MKLLFVDDFKLGVLTGNTVVDVSREVGNIMNSGPHDLINKLIERFADYRKPLESAIKNGKGLPVSGVRIRPPLPRPINIDCMARNYMESGTREKPEPINAFHKSPGTIVGNGDTMIFGDIPASAFEAEGEMAVVIGKRASHVKASAAMQHVFGYVNFIDGSARGLGKGNNFFGMKSRETYGPVGPWIVTADEIPDPHKLRVRLWVNGDLKQDYNTSDMAYNIPRCIEWISAIHPLEPGDILAMGTNHLGLSSLQDGDKVELETEGLGRLVIHCRDDLKRTWPRITRGERAKATGEDGPSKQLTGKYAKV